MIYHLPTLNEPIDQGDLIDGCPVCLVTAFSTDQLDSAKVRLDLRRVIVLNQTCDITCSPKAISNKAQGQWRSRATLGKRAIPSSE